MLQTLPPSQTQDPHPTSVTEAKQMGTALFQAGCHKASSLQFCLLVLVL